MKTEEEQDGTIIEFLLGQKPFQGVWFGDKHPAHTGKFWWRTCLREHASQFKTVEPEKKTISSIEFKCHCCGEYHTGKNDDQLYEICNICFDRL